MPLTFGQRLRYFTPTLIFLTIYLSLATLNFGYDVGTFGGVQGMASFKERFGKYDSKTEKFALPVYLSSIMNSTPFIGKLIGALSCGPIAERWGRKPAVAILACISLIGVALQTSATSAAQFTIGRIINFGMTGFCIVVTPIYMSECAPAQLRGMITSFMQFQIGLGQTIAASVNYGTANLQGNKAWQIPIGIQFVVPIVILALLPLMPESPRWLLSKSRSEQAAKSLQRIRSDRSTDEIQLEISQLSAMSVNREKGSWLELFNTTNRIRTAIAVLVMLFQQITGQAFVSQYSIVFYQKEGITNPSPFLLGIIGNLVSLACVTFVSSFVDRFGRRVLLLTGGGFMAAFLLILGGVGTVAEPTTAQKNLMVAAVMLYGAGYALSWAPISYIVLGEVAASRVKEKTNDLAVSVSVVTTFIVSFTLPYLLNAPYANLGAKVGFIYGSTTVLSIAVAFFCVPEMKGLSLETIDRLFAEKVPLRDFQRRAAEMGPAVDGEGFAAKEGFAKNGGEVEMFEDVDRRWEKV